MTEKQVELLTLIYNKLHITYCVQEDNWYMLELKKLIEQSS